MYEFFYGGIFSQFFPCTFTERGVSYNSAEQYMMAQKALLFNDIKTYDKIMSLSNPHKIKALGRLVKNFDQEMWDKHKEDIVFKGNLLKFSQNKKLCKQLLATGDKEIVEASPTDTIWGIGLAETDPAIYNKDNWKGTNLLGKAIMKVRDVLKDTKLVQANYKETL